MTRNDGPAPGLLVSVRSVVEAEAALRGGAALIDVKEPSRGPLGRADDDVIAQVSEAVAGRRPVSAAFGELQDDPHKIPKVELDYVKWGLRGCRGKPDWKRLFADMIASRAAGQPRLVVVAYADFELAEAPPVEDVANFASQWPGNVFMIDTFTKAPGHLLDWLSFKRICALCCRCRDAYLKVALAGSLTRELIAQLAPLRPDWFAVRGAVCGKSDRQAAVEESRVRALVQLLASTVKHPVEN